jgi:hypothetical protein
MEFTLPIKLTAGDVRFPLAVFADIVCEKGRCKEGVLQEIVKRKTSNWVFNLRLPEWREIEFLPIVASEYRNCGEAEVYNPGE